jgi:hypothetical protein
VRIDARQYSGRLVTATNEMDRALAIGGNDALQNSDLLSLRVNSSRQALEIFADRIGRFERAYRSAISQAIALGRYTAVCTVYNGALEPERATVERIGLALFNDVILRAAVDLRLNALELRSICTVLVAIALARRRRDLVRGAPVIPAVIALAAAAHV